MKSPPTHNIKRNTRFNRSGKSATRSIAFVLIFVVFIVAISAYSNAAINTPVLKEVRKLQTKGYINAVAWNADGSRLAALSKLGSHVTLWETQHWSVVKEFDAPASAYSRNSLAFLPDGSLLIAAPIGMYTDVDDSYPARTKGQIREHVALVQWNAETGEVKRYIPNATTNETFTVSRNGEMVAGIGGNGVSIYSGKTGTLLTTIKIRPRETLPDAANALTFSPDGNELAVCTAFGRIQFFNTLDGAHLRSFIAYPNDEYRCESLAYSPQGKVIAATKAKTSNVREPNDITATLWNPTDGKPAYFLPGSTWVLHEKNEAVTSRTLSWNKNGTLLAVGDDASLRVWKIGTSAQLVLKRDIRRGSFSVEFSSTGLLAATDNNSILIYQ